MTTAHVSMTPLSLRSLRWTQLSHEQGAASRVDILVILHRLRRSGGPPQLAQSHERAEANKIEKPRATLCTGRQIRERLLPRFQGERQTELQTVYLRWLMVRAPFSGSNFFIKAKSRFLRQWCTAVAPSSFS